MPARITSSVNDEPVSGGPMTGGIGPYIVLTSAPSFARPVAGEQGRRSPYPTDERPVLRGGETEARGSMDPSGEGRSALTPA
jgi:hypothetical protein